MDIRSSILNNLLSSTEHDEDDYSRLMEEEVETDELEDILCQEEKEVIWTKRRVTNT